MLPVAPSAASGFRERAGLGHPIRAGLEDLDGVSPQVARVAVAFRHDGDDPLPRQGVPDEDDSSLVPCHTVATVGDGADLELETRTDADGVQGWSPRRRDDGATQSPRSAAKRDELSW